MSRYYKVSSVRQADDAINDLHNRLNRTNREMTTKIANAQAQAVREAERRTQSLIEQERRRMQSVLNKEISGVNANIRELDRAQRQRLQNTANRLENLIDSENDKLRRETQSGLNALKNNINTLAKTTRQQNEATNARIDAVNALSKSRYESVQRRITELARDTTRRFDDQQRQLDAQQGQLNTHEQRLGALTDTVNGILSRLSNEDERRHEAVNMAKAIYEEAFKRTPIDRFNPEEATRIHDRMERLLSNPNSTTAAAQAVEAIMNIQWAEEKALKAKIIYDAILSQAMESLNTVLEEVNSNREISVSNPNDNSDIIKIEVDFWNRGEYSQISNRLETLKKELEAQPSTDRINQIISEISECEVMATDMAGVAAHRAILSENRVEITEDIITALQTQGWQIERDPEGMDEIGYEGGEIDNDWREGVYAYLRSMNGERIVIRVTPSGDEIDNDIAFHRVDNRSITSNEFIRSLQTLKSQIEKSGHKLGDIKAPKGDGGDVMLAEISASSRLAKKGAAQNIRRKMRGH